MVDIYFKCDWCQKTVEHKHIEKGHYVFGNYDRSKKLQRIELQGKDSYVCENCYNVIQNKVQHLKALSESSGPYRELTDEEKSNLSRSTSKDYQDNGVIVTCENK